MEPTTIPLVFDGSMEIGTAVVYPNGQIHATITSPRARTAMAELDLHCLELHSNPKEVLWPSPPTT